MADRLGHLPPIRKPDASSDILDILQQVRDEAEEDAGKRASVNSDTSARKDIEKSGQTELSVSKETDSVSKKKGPSKKTGSILDLSKEVEGNNLWEQFVNLCPKETKIRRSTGVQGICTQVGIERDLMATLKQCKVEGYSCNVMINAIVRSFILHYKDNFASYKKEVPATSLI